MNNQQHQSITIVNLPTLNKLIDTNRANRYKGASLKKEWTDLIARMAKDNLVPIVGPIWLVLELEFERTSSDPDNQASGALKLMLDGLTQAGILKDDSFKTIRSPILINFKKGKVRQARLNLIPNQADLQPFLKEL